jgi:acetoin utilization deacetylase AcuC-like enzyme
LTLQASGQAKSVGILDLDFHLGNGTIDIIKRLDAKHVKHRTSGAKFHSRRDAGENATSYFKWLTDAIEYMQDCDVILYQAGADAWVEDPLGGCLTLEELQQRDRMVFEGFQGKPLAWCLAGGYAKDDAGSIEPVLAIHRQTALECICASGKAQLQ